MSQAPHTLPGSNLRGETVKRGNKVWQSIFMTMFFGLLFFMNQ